MGRTRMGRTDGRTDGLTDGRTDGRTRRRLYGPPKFFGEHKNIDAKVMALVHCTHNFTELHITFQSDAS